MILFKPLAPAHMLSRERKQPTDFFFFPVRIIANEDIVRKSEENYETGHLKPVPFKLQQGLAS